MTRTTETVTRLIARLRLSGHEIAAEEVAALGARIVELEAKLAARDRQDAANAMGERVWE